MGYLGAIIDTTNVSGILRIDVLATDWFHDSAYPTYLYYNGHDASMQVDVQLPPGTHDLYDLVTNAFIENGVSGAADVTLAAGEAVLIAILPADGAVTYEGDRFLVNDIVVDYDAGIGTDHPPRIKACGTPTPVIEADHSLNLFCEAEDREDGDDLTFLWYLNGNQLAATGSGIQITAPAEPGTYLVSSTVADQSELTVTDSFQVEVVEYINYAPVIVDLAADPLFLSPGMETSLTCTATDENPGDILEYTWSAPDGGVLSGEGYQVNWLATNGAGEFRIGCRVEDSYGASDSTSITIIVTGSGGEYGTPVLYLPFSGNVNDYSGFENHGILSGALFVADRGGNPDAALHFDGSDDRVQIPGDISLNFTDAITVSLWINVEEFFGREAYPISHGNWENRWKLSITNQRVRWTVKTSTGIRDLDSATELESGVYYHVVALYDGENFDLYLNGALDQHTTFSGDIQTTNYDLTIGQVLPGNSQYNFKGWIDDIRLYDYGLDAETIAALFQEPLGAIGTGHQAPPQSFQLQSAYPNPFNAGTVIRFGLPASMETHVAVYDLRGRHLVTLLQGLSTAGWHELTWNGRDGLGRPLTSGLYLCQVSTGDQVETIKLHLLK